ncbi:Neutral protease 2 [Tolypocladium ophioglossoides CBS 100239]|uniref:Neutral protease 2 n=1 Tax=Tolypocladium ophioglossoides (strain CBS 100239) TaxID=1163406 RepID=A0A0L0N7F7_TOLOC|nr:Neutral protease 2 [Tolypocladium ophioglossoides CBS 100239]
MKFFGSVALLASLVVAAPSAVKDNAASPLNVKVEMTGNSLVTAVFTNTGQDDLKLLKTGTVFSKQATRKARVSSNGKELAFEGEYVSVDLENLSDAAFQPIAAGQSVEVKFDIAEVHDLSAGGKYILHATGRLPYAKGGETKISGSVSYSSNKLEAMVDGKRAAGLLLSFMKRANVQDCEGSKLAALKTAIANCKKLASAAQEAANSGPDGRMDEYFKSSSKSTRSTVSDIYSKVQGQCSSTDSGTKASCYNDHGQCDKGALAVTTSGKTTVFCDNFFSNLPAVADQCHAKSQATSFLHETTHIRAVAGTDDVAYGYDDLRKLSAEDAIRNADTFALFANAVDLGCAVPASGAAGQEDTDE